MANSETNAHRTPERIMSPGNLPDSLHKHHRCHPRSLAKGFWTSWHQKKNEHPQTQQPGYFPNVILLFHLLLGLPMQMKNCSVLQTTCVRFWQTQSINRSQLLTAGLSLLPTPQVQEGTNDLLAMRSTGVQQVSKCQHATTVITYW